MRLCGLWMIWYGNEGGVSENVLGFSEQELLLCEVKNKSEEPV